jgi:hypothetical protein
VPLNEGDLRRCAESAAGNLALTWRWLGSSSSGAEPRAVFHYLLSRSLGLRLLLEKGIALPFFGLDALRERAAREFPETKGFLSRLAPLDANASLEDAFYAHYPFFDEQIRRTLAALRLDSPPVSGLS